VTGLRRPSLLLISLLVGVLAAAGVAACGNRSKPINIVQQDDGGGGAPGPDSAFLDCLRANGVQVPTAFPSRFPRPSGSRRPRPSGSPGFNRPSGFPRASGFPRPSGFPRAFGSIPAACASLRPSFSRG
jgi:hypothetical protein